MKKIYVQKQVIGWENYEYEVPDNFKDYQSLIRNYDWSGYEILEDSLEETGLVKLYNEDYNEIEF